MMAKAFELVHVVSLVLDVVHKIHEFGSATVRLVIEEDEAIWMDVSLDASIGVFGLVLYLPQEGMGCISFAEDLGELPCWLVLAERFDLVHKDPVAWLQLGSFDAALLATPACDGGCVG